MVNFSLIATSSTNMNILLAMANNLLIWELTNPAIV